MYILIYILYTYIFVIYACMALMLDTKHFFRFLFWPLCGGFSIGFGPLAAAGQQDADFFTGLMYEWS